jgi:hypothetical protein
LSFAFALHERRRHAAQFAVHAWRQGFQRLPVAIGPGKKKLRRFSGLRFHVLVDHDIAKKNVAAVVVLTGVSRV